MGETVGTSWHGCRRLVGKVIVVAGASTGIGRATSLRLAGEGARLVVGSPSWEADKIQSLVAEIEAAGGEAVGTEFDANSDQSAAAIISLAVGTYGRLDAVHANFANMRLVIEDTDAISVSDKVIDGTLEVNFKGVLRITRCAVPALLEFGGGAMIYTSSMASVVGEEARPVYGMTKAAINALVRHLASNWGKQGLRANAVLPGLVVTPEHAPYMTDDMKQPYLDACRSPRVGEPDDIAAMVALLASADGSWISGQTISVDGGQTMR